MNLEHRQVSAAERRVAVPAPAFPRRGGRVNAGSQPKHTALTRHHRPPRSECFCLATFLLRMAEVMRAGAGVKLVDGAAEGFHTRQKSKFLLSLLEGLP